MNLIKTIESDRKTIINNEPITAHNHICNIKHVKCEESNKKDEESNKKGEESNNTKNSINAEKTMEKLFMSIGLINDINEHELIRKMDGIKCNNVPLKLHGKLSVYDLYYFKISNKLYFFDIENPKIVKYIELKTRDDFEGYESIMFE
jgi:hypothetical protein